MVISKYISRELKYSYLIKKNYVDQLQSTTMLECSCNKEGYVCEGM